MSHDAAKGRKGRGLSAGQDSAPCDDIDLNGPRAMRRAVVNRIGQLAAWTGDPTICRLGLSFSPPEFWPSPNPRISKSDLSAPAPNTALDSSGQFMQTQELWIRNSSSVIDPEHAHRLATIDMPL